MASMQIIATDNAHLTIQCNFDQGADNPGYSSYTFTSAISGLTGHSAIPSTLTLETGLSDALTGSELAFSGASLYVYQQSGPFSPATQPNTVVWSGTNAQLANMLPAMESAAQSVNDQQVPYDFLVNNCGAPVPVTGVPCIIPQLPGAGRIKNGPDLIDVNLGPYMPIGRWNGLQRAILIPVAFYRWAKDELYHLRKDDVWSQNTVPTGSTSLMQKPTSNIPTYFQELLQTFLQQVTQFVDGTQSLAGSFDLDALNQLVNSLVADEAGPPPSLFGSKQNTKTGNVQGGNSLDGSSGGTLAAGFGGNNTLIGGGNDTLFGGSGKNTFAFGQPALAAAESSSATSTVLDYNQTNQTGGFSASQGDVVDVSAIVSASYDQGSGKPVASSLLHPAALPRGGLTRQRLHLSTRKICSDNRDHLTRPTDSAP